MPEAFQRSPDERLFRDGVGNACPAEELAHLGLFLDVHAFEVDQYRRRRRLKRILELRDDFYFLLFCLCHTFLQTKRPFANGPEFSVPAWD